MRAGAAFFGAGRCWVRCRAAASGGEMRRKRHSFRPHNAAPRPRPQCRPSVRRLCRPYRERRKRHYPKRPPLSAPLQPPATRRNAPSPPSPEKGRPRPRLVGLLAVCGIFSQRCRPPPLSVWRYVSRETLLCLRLHMQLLYM